MTDIVRRLYEMADDITYELAAQEITRLRAEIAMLRADLLKAEMQTENAGLENIMRAVARGRREGIEAAVKVCDERMHAYRTGTPTDETMAAIEEVADLLAAIRALLEDGQ